MTTKPLSPSAKRRARLDRIARRIAAAENTTPREARDLAAQQLAASERERRESIERRQRARERERLAERLRLETERRAAIREALAHSERADRATVAVEMERDRRRAALRMRAERERRARARRAFEAAGASMTAAAIDWAAVGALEARPAPAPLEIGPPPAIRSGGWGGWARALAAVALAALALGGCRPAPASPPAVDSVPILGASGAWHCPADIDDTEEGPAR